MKFTAVAAVAVAALAATAAAAPYRRTERYYGQKVYQWYVDFAGAVGAGSDPAGDLTGNPAAGRGGLRTPQHLPR